MTYVAAVGDNADSMEMRYEDENIWLTQKMMAQISRHLEYIIIERWLLLDKFPHQKKYLSLQIFRMNMRIRKVEWA